MKSKLHTVQALLVMQAVLCPSGESGHEGDQLQPEQEGPHRGQDPPPPLRIHGQTRQADQKADLQVGGCPGQFRQNGHKKLAH